MKNFTTVLLLTLGFILTVNAAETAKKTVLVNKKFGPSYRWGNVVYLHGAKGLTNPAEVKALARVDYNENGAVLTTDEKLKTLKDGKNRKIYLSNNITRSVNLPEDAGNKNFILKFDIEGKGQVQLIAVIMGKKGDKAFKTQTWTHTLQAGKRIHTLKRKLPSGSARAVCFCRLETPGKITVKSVDISLE